MAPDRLVLVPHAMLLYLLTIYILQTADPVINKENDKELMLKEDKTLRECGVGNDILKLFLVTLWRITITVMVPTTIEWIINVWKNWLLSTLLVLSVDVTVNLVLFLCPRRKDDMSLERTTSLSVIFLLGFAMVWKVLENEFILKSFWKLVKCLEKYLN